MNRRHFLKIMAGTTGALAVNPLQAFSRVLPESELTENGVVYSLGFGEIFIGSSGENISKDVVCLRRSIGMASVNLNISNDVFQVKNGFPSLEMEELFKSAVFIECQFQKQPNIIGSIGRVESVFTYPDGNNQMVLIFPKASMKKDKNKIIFTSIHTKHPVWEQSPMGKVLFLET